jgi:hypothetical protein
MTGSELMALAVAAAQGLTPLPQGTVREDEHRRAAVYGPAEEGEATPPAPDLDWSTPPGGYWRTGEVRAPEPPDGREKLIAAYILIPLGALGTASGAAATWMSAPGHCEERWSSVGASPDAEQCRGLLILNSIRTTYGALMLGSGLVLLGIGLHQRKKWRAWKARGGVGVWWNGSGAGVDLTWRF